MISWGSRIVWTWDERPSPGSDDMLVSLTIVGDVDPRSREIVPVYSILRVLLGKDVLGLVGVVLNKMDLVTVYHWSGVRSFASDAFCFQPVSLMDLGFMTVMRDKGLIAGSP